MFVVVCCLLLVVCSVALVGCAVAVVVCHSLSFVNVVCCCSASFEADCLRSVASSCLPLFAVVGWC